MCVLTLVNYTENRAKRISGTFSVTGELPTMDVSCAVFRIFKLADGSVVANWSEQFGETVHEIQSSVAIYFEPDPQPAESGVSSEYFFSASTGFEFRVPFPSSEVDSLLDFAGLLEDYVDEPATKDERANLEAKLGSLDGVRKTINQLKAIASLIRHDSKKFEQRLFCDDGETAVENACEKATNDFDSEATFQEIDMPCRRITIRMTEDSESGHIVCDGIVLTERGEQEFSKLHAECA